METGIVIAHAHNYSNYVLAHILYELDRQPEITANTRRIPSPLWGGLGWGELNKDSRMVIEQRLNEHKNLPRDVKRARDVKNNVYGVVETILKHAENLVSKKRVAVLAEPPPP
jgi:hypothetical protein